MRKNPPAGAPPESVTLEMALVKAVDHMRSMQAALDLMAARSVAHEAMLTALISSHPDPDRLFEEHATQLDASGLGLTSELREDFMKELQHFQRLILRAVNSKSCRT